jgi:hypothetical protein
LARGRRAVDGRELARRQCTVAAPMRVSFSVDAGRIELAASPTADPGDHHLALDVMVGARPTGWVVAARSAAAGHDEPG